MAKRGPKPKPTPLKILEGYKRYQVNRDEPVVPPGTIEAPGWLSGLALEHWDELAPMLAKAGLLSKGDRPALALMCNAYRKIRENPDDSKSEDKYIRLLTEFGLTPSSRSRIKAPTEKPKDELDEHDREFKTG